MVTCTKCNVEIEVSEAITSSKGKTMCAECHSQKLKKKESSKKEKFKLSSSFVSFKQKARGSLPEDTRRRRSLEEDKPTANDDANEERKKIISQIKGNHQSKGKGLFIMPDRSLKGENEHDV